MWEGWASQIAWFVVKTTKSTSDKSISYLELTSKLKYDYCGIFST